MAASWKPDLLGGIVTLDATASRMDVSQWGPHLYQDRRPAETPSPLTAVPYFLWCNRGPNAMQVWLRE